MKKLVYYIDRHSLIFGYFMCFMVMFFDIIIFVLDFVLFLKYCRLQTTYEY